MPDSSETGDVAKARQRLDSALTELKVKMDVLDELDRQLQPSLLIELVVKIHDHLRIKIDGNRNHARPHLHLDCGKVYHAASYAIDDGSCLAGSNKYDRVMASWIGQHHDDLLKVWHGVRATGAPEEIVAQLRVTSFG